MNCTYIRKIQKNLVIQCNHTCICNICIQTCQSLNTDMNRWSLINSGVWASKKLVLHTYNLAPRIDLVFKSKIILWLFLTGAHACREMFLHTYYMYCMYYKLHIVCIRCLLYTCPTVRPLQTQFCKKSDSLFHS